METLVLDGKSFIKASKAARDLGYTSDYVGQLCRSGQVAAHLVGRTWYVDQEQLSGHRVEKKRMARVKAREQAHKSIEEHKQLRVSSQNSYKNVAIHYESDDEALIPTPRKLSVASAPVEHASAPAPVEEDPKEPKYEIENKGKKIVLSGKLKVTDAGEEVVVNDKDTVVLTPRINRKKISPATMARIEEPIRQEEVVATESETASENEPETIAVSEHKPKNFLTRLEEYEADTTPIVAEQGEAEPLAASVQAVTSVEAPATKTAALSFVYGILLPIMFVGGSMITSAEWTTDNNNVADPQFISTYRVDLESTFEILRFKIKTSRLGDILSI